MSTDESLLTGEAASQVRLPALGPLPDFTPGVQGSSFTGDHAATAQAIAGQIGLAPRALVLTGAQIAQLDDQALRRRLAPVDICARPALVLLDDSFASITTAIRQGRQIDDNIRTAIRFIFAVHVPIVVLALLPVLLHWPLLLLPAQIVLLELIIEPAAANVMQRPPRAAEASPFATGNVVLGVLLGLGLGLGLALALALGCWWMVDGGWWAPAGPGRPCALLRSWRWWPGSSC